MGLVYVATLRRDKEAYKSWELASGEWISRREQQSAKHENKSAGSKLRFLPTCQENQSH